MADQPNTGERLSLLEWRVAELSNEIRRIRQEDNERAEKFDGRLGRILFAGWALIASILGGATAMVIAAVVLRGH